MNILVNSVTLNCINKTHWRTDPWFIHHFSKECCQAHITWSYQISTPVISEFQSQGGNSSSSALRKHYVNLTTQVQSVSATRWSNWQQYTGHQICKLYRYKFYFFLMRNGIFLPLISNPRSLVSLFKCILFVS